MATILPGSNSSSMRHRGIQVVVVLLMGVWVVAGCGRDSMCHTPTGLADFVLYPNSAMYAGLNHVGGGLYVHGGHLGIAIVRTTLEEFAAYERTCPVDTNTTLWFSDSLGTAVLECPKCHSLFSTYTQGVPIGESATACALYQYTTTYNGNELYVM